MTDDGAVWDLRVYGEPVQTVEDLLHWLSAHRKSRPEQEAALRRFVEMNRRDIPDALAEELAAWTQAPTE